MNKLFYIIALLPLYIAADVQLPAQPAHSGPYASTTARSTYYGQYFLDNAKQITAMKPADYKVFTIMNTVVPLLTPIDRNHKVPEKETNQYWLKQNGQILSPGNTKRSAGPLFDAIIPQSMSLYDADGNARYTIKGPEAAFRQAVTGQPVSASLFTIFDNKDQPIRPSAGTIVPQIVADANGNVVWLNDKVAMYPLISNVPDFKVSNAMPIRILNAKAGIMLPAATAQIGTIPAFAKATYESLMNAHALDPKAIPGMGGILYYDKRGHLLAGFYTDGWANVSEGWHSADELRKILPSEFLTK